MTRKRREMIRQSCLHLTLVVGAVLFSFPFFWLVSTSFKADREIFVSPPQWIPQVPYQVEASPYVAYREFGRWPRPPGLTEERWRLLQDSLLARGWEKMLDYLAATDPRQPSGAGGPAVSWAGQPGWLSDRTRPGGDAGRWSQSMQTILGDRWPVFRQEMLEGVLGEILLRIGVSEQAAAAVGTDALISAWLAQITPERIHGVWRKVYRHLAFGRLTVQDIFFEETRVTDVRGRSLEGWLAESSNLRVASLIKVDGQPALEIPYDLRQPPRSGKAHRRLSYRMLLPAPLDEVKQITLAIKGDESYHKLYLKLEARGIVYRASKPFILEFEGWKDAVWQFEKPTPREVDHVHLVPDRSAPSTVMASDEARLTLELIKSPYWWAVYRKFIRNYLDTFKFVPLFRFLANTAILTALNILGQLFACSIIAYGFARLRWPGRDAVFVLLLATMMLPGQVTMIPQFLIWRRLGMYDTFQPLWVPSLFGSGFFIFLLRQFFLTIPTDLEDAARIDGCGFFGVYWRIMLPLIKPALAAIAIFQFMGSWNDFMGPLIYISSEHLTPLSLGLFMLRSAHTAEWGMLMAASTMMTLPVILLFFFTQRYFIQGVTLTGMKE